jgi:hypothetical protein
MSSSPSQTAPSETSSIKKMPPMINILNAVAFFANMFVLYGLGLFLHINSEVLATFPTLITPASWARLLWPLIVLVEFAWVILQLLPKYRSEELVTVVGRNFIFASIAQMAWSLCFSYQILSLSFLSIITMLVFLFIIFRAQSNVECNLQNYFFFKFPFSLLFGWMVIACVVNINVLLVAMGVSTSTQFYAAIVSLSAILIVAGSVQDFTVLAVLAWAMVITCLYCCVCYILYSFVLTCFVFCSCSLDWNICRNWRSRLLHSIHLSGHVCHFDSLCFANFLSHSCGIHCVARIFGVAKCYEKASCGNDSRDYCRGRLCQHGITNVLKDLLYERVHQH